MSIFRKKRIILFLSVFLVILFMNFATKAIGFDWILMFTKFTNAFTRFLQLYIPPDFTHFSKMLDELFLTVFMAISGSATGMIFAFFASLTISKKTSRNAILRFIFRTLASFCRNVPEGIWAIILLMCFWFGEFLAYLVMSIMSFGFLSRVFADTIDETNADCIEALEATGASYWQIIVNAVIPEVLPSLISWSLYSAENNIRSSTIVGMLAGGGIGYLMGNYQHMRQFDSMFVAIALVVITVIIFDQISTQIRKRILA